MGKFGIPAKHHEAIALIYAKVSNAVSTFESFFATNIISHILDPYYDLMF